MFTKDRIAKEFSISPVLVVKFTKKNGDKREMVCTTNMDLIPKKFHPKPLKDGEKPRVPSDTVCNVYELDVGWRSFRYDSVISTSILPE